MSDAITTSAKAVLPDDVLPELEALCRQFDIRSLTLFGSANTPEFDPARSDIDFLVDYEDGAGGSFGDFFALKEAMEALFGRQVDLLKRAQIINPYVLRTIERNQRQIIPRLPPGATTSNERGIAMLSDLSAGLLWDVSRGLSTAIGYASEVTRAEYDATPVVREAIYFRLTVVGEALARLRKIDPATASQIPQLSDVVGMRNILVHEYGKIDDDRIWEAATISAPELKALVDSLLQSVSPSFLLRED